MKKQFLIMLSNSVLSVIILVNMTLLNSVSAANVQESEPNDVFLNLTDVTTGLDFSQAQIPEEGDIYMGAVGVGSPANFPPPPIPPGTDILMYNDIDTWVFQLQENVLFTVFITKYPTFGPNTSEALVLFEERPDGFVPVRAISSGTTNVLSFLPTETRTYYLTLSGSNNPPRYANSTPATFGLTGGIITSFSALGASTFTYDLLFEGVFPPVPPYNLPTINSNTAQVSDSLGNGSLSWLLLSGLFGIVCLVRRKK